jgi:hypothetical protein
MEKVENEQEQAYLYHYNPYTKLWNKFRREDMAKYFNGDKTINVNKGADIKNLSHD